MYVGTYVSDDCRFLVIAGRLKQVCGLFRHAR